MRWTVHGERSIYDSAWMRLVLVDVEIPGAQRFDHHVVRYPQAAAGTVVHDPDRGVLLLWRHRFITDTWGWEIPAGGVEPGETPEQAAVRETLEETGWRPGPLRPLGSYAPSNGSSDQIFHAFVADGATHVGEPADPAESERIAWIPVAEVRDLIAGGGFTDGLSLTSLLWALALSAI
ncbi:MAG TPA: NUDIX hydrolase [Acidimicrobiales bacterium]